MRQVEEEGRRMMSAILTTERLWLREWLTEDFEDFKAIATHPNVMKYIGTGELWSDARIRHFFDYNAALQRQHNFSLWAVVDQRTQRLMGLCGLSLFQPTREIEIGWWLAPDQWGQGFATEAAQAVMAYGFEQLKLSRIIAIAQPINRRSIRVMHKLGMQFEKITVDRHGIDVIYYAKTITPPQSGVAD